MFTQGTAGHDELAVYSLDTGSVDVLDTNGFTTNVRGSGWSADGTRYAFHHLINNASYTEVVDVATGTFHALPVAYGELSNDGGRVVGMEPGRGGLCVIPVDGSTCTAVTEPYGNGWGWYYRWSPDDASIITSRIDGMDFVLDPDGPPTQAQPSWMADGGDSWQRRGS
jgi:Tol biopolymer transport system component